MSTLIKNNKNNNKIRCKYCKKQFTPKSSLAKTCSSSCRKAFSRKVTKQKTQETCVGFLNYSCPDNKSTKAKRCRVCKRKHNRVNGFFNTSFGARVAHELKERAHSVELIDGIEGLEAYYQCHRLVASSNVIVDGKSERNFHVAHKVAVNSEDGKRGLYSKENLVVIPAKLNQKLGNKVVYYFPEPNVHYKSEGELKKDLRVSSNTTNSKLRELLINHLGIEFIDWVDSKNLPKRQQTSSNFSFQGKPVEQIAISQSLGVESQYLIGESSRVISKDVLPDLAKVSTFEKGYWETDTCTESVTELDKAYEKFYCELTGIEFFYGYFMSGMNFYEDESSPESNHAEEDAIKEPWG